MAKTVPPRVNGARDNADDSQALASMGASVNVAARMFAELVSHYETGTPSPGA